MNTTRIRLSVLLAIFLSLTIFFGAARIFAGSGDNVFGYAWSSNTGWIKLNNCDSATNCAGQTYGVSAVMTAPGTLNGYAWSSNLGWVTFNDPACPSKSVPGCTPGAHVDWSHPNADGSFNIKGWARVCSVYVSGCGGQPQSNLILGGWDGYIALGDPNAASNASWGLTVAKDMSINGYAWGSDVVGWVQLIGAKIVPTAPVDGISDFDPKDPGVIVNTHTPTNPPGGTGTKNNPPGGTGSGSPSDPGVTNNPPSFTWDTTGDPKECTITDGTTTETVDTSSQAAGGTLAADGKYYYQSNFIVTKTTTFTLQCGTATKTLTITVYPSCDIGTTLNKTTAQCDPKSCPSGLGWSDDAAACIATPSTCSTGQVWNSSANNCINLPSCPTGQTWSTATNQCQAVQACTGTQVWNAQLNVCQEPTANGCPIGQSPDASGQCVATVCPASTKLNAKTGACDARKKPIFQEF